jgi:hypothetical protein
MGDEDDETSRIPTALVKSLIAEGEDEATTKIPVGMVRSLLEQQGITEAPSPGVSAVVPPPIRRRVPQAQLPPQPPIADDLAPLASALIDIVEEAPPPSPVDEVEELDDIDVELDVGEASVVRETPSGEEKPTDAEKYLLARLNTVTR